MILLEGIVLGIIQGIAEWLPVSSEGLTSIIMVNFFNKKLSEAVSIALWLHIGTLASALIYFRQRIWSIVKNLRGYNPRSNDMLDRLTTFIVLATLSTGIVGAPLYLIGIEEFTLTGKAATAFIGSLLIFTGLIMRLSNKRIKEREEERSMDGLLSGIAQGLAILPGISRSGFTTSILLLRNYDPRKALELSFIISIPAVIGAQLLLQLNEALVVTPAMFTAALTSFIVGYLTIDALLRVGRRIDFSYFVIFIGILSLSILLF